MTGSQAKNGMKYFIPFFNMLIKRSRTGTHLITVRHVRRYSRGIHCDSMSTFLIRLMTDGHLAAVFGGSLVRSRVENNDLRDHNLSIGIAQYHEHYLIWSQCDGATGLGRIS